MILYLRCYHIWEIIVFITIVEITSLNTWPTSLPYLESTKSSTLPTIEFNTSEFYKNSINYNNSIFQEHNYVIKQGIEVDNNQIYLHSPYVLWNEKVDIFSPVLKTPIELRSVNGILDIELNVQATTFKGLFSFNTRLFCLNDVCSFPGPTLVCNPGDKLRIKLINSLLPTGSIVDNIEYFPNRTNIFIGGIEIDSRQNNPFRYTNGGGDHIIYEYSIKADANAGLHYYQSRVHGYSAMQVMGGLHGALIVEPLPNHLPISHQSKIRHTLVLSHVQLDRNNRTIPALGHEGYSDIDDASDYESSSLSLTYLSKLVGSNLIIDAKYIDKYSVIDAWLTNGQYQPTLSMQPSEWRIMDILVASPDRIIELELRNAVGIDHGSQVCSMKLLALDGTYLNYARNDSFVRHLVLYQSSRASIAIMCDTVGEYYLQSASTLNESNIYYSFGDFQTKSIQNLLTIKIEGTKYFADEPTSNLTLLAKPSISSLINSNAIHENLSISTAQSGCCNSNNSKVHYWVGLGLNCQLPCYDDSSCTSLYNNIDYSVTRFPTVMNGACAYRSYSDDNSSEFTHELSSADPLIITIYSHYQHLIPIFIHGDITSSQILSFENVNINNSNIDFSINGYNVNKTVDNIRDFATPGDWRQIYPPLMGKWTIITPTILASDVFILTSFLKFEDRGFIQKVKIIHEKDLVITLNQSTLTASPGPIPDLDLIIPKSVLDNPNSSPDVYLCNTTGHSWVYKEEIDLASATRVITSNSCPNHYSVCQHAECGGSIVTRALQLKKIIEIPLFPKFSKTRLDLTCTSEMLGVALNGVGIYGSGEEKMRACVKLENISDPIPLIGRTTCRIPGKNDGIEYCGDVIPLLGKSFDKCGGYGGTDGIYRYYVPPVCLLHQLSNYSISGHSPQVGWALDGFPIYGPIGARKVVMKKCGSFGAHPHICLDSCNGYYGWLPGYDDFKYRYYIPGEVGNGLCNNYVNNSGDCAREDNKCCLSTVPSVTYRPYTIGCYRGCRIGDENCISTGEKGTSSNYIPSSSQIIKNIYLSDEQSTTTTSITASYNNTNSNNNKSNNSNISNTENGESNTQNYNK
eukprot:gene9836-13230_t